MKVLLVNHTCGVGSTGRICAEIAEKYIADDHEAVVAYGRGSVPERYQSISRKFGSNLNSYWHCIDTRLTDRHGFASKHATKVFLKWADAYDPDILWLHNIHGYYINIEMLFAWIKSRPQMKVKWTLHDCWAFTGHCSYFTLVNCERWKTHCSHCIQKREYPASYVVDNCEQNFDRKKEAFTRVKDMTLITPSQWLADLVKQSFLKEYPVEVHYNTIDTNVFKPTPSDFRERYGLQDKKIVLGVANVWHERKGLSDFLQLAKMLDDSYVIVLVGLTQKEINNLPKNVKEFTRTNMQDKTTSIEVVRTRGGVAIKPSVENLYAAITGEIFSNQGKNSCQMLLLSRTNSVKELAEIYTAADVFCNPTYEDNYPTTNLEAQACGTWVITYDVGGSKETLHD